MKQIRVKENINRRYLGAVRFVDNTTKGVVRRPFNIDAKGLCFIVNASYLHVIASAEDLEEHTHSFDSPPDQPVIKSKIFDVTITDPLQKYLPRRKRIELPRNADPGSDDSLFEPIQVPMFSASSGCLNPNWSIIRASVIKFGQDDPEQPLKGALLRIIRDEDGRLIATGLTDHRGEALIVVPGIPFHDFVTDEDLPDDESELDHDYWLATGDVVKKETSVKVEAILDRTLSWPVDPEVLEENRNEWLCKAMVNKNGELADSVNLKLKTGQTQIIKFYISVPDGA
jgi:hypothetical protein